MEKILRRIIFKIMKQYYMRILRGIKDNQENSKEFYDSAFLEDGKDFDEHVFHFPNNIDIPIQYSIPVIRLLAKDEEIQYVSFDRLKELLEHDLEETKCILDDIRKMIIKKKKHKEKTLLLIFYEPHQQYLLLDGRHRFVEYEKFEPNAKEIPILALKSKYLCSAIINKVGFVAYHIQNNLNIILTKPFYEWKNEMIKIRSIL